MIDLSVLGQIVSEWSYRSARPAPSVPRRLLDLEREWTPDLVWVVQGVRRCGKSTLLAQIMERKRLPPDDCYFVNFEDPRLSGELNPKLLDAIVTLARQRSVQRPKYFFFDEIQDVFAWEKFLHARLERPRDEHYVITGSNSALLAGDLGTTLTGRHLTLELFPFSWSEYRAAKAGGLEDYLEHGGFPRALTATEPHALLRQYFTDIIERDVRRHVAARSTTVLTQVCKSIFESTGSDTSLRKLAAVSEIAVDTIKAYVEAFTAAYLILPCTYFTFSERKRMVRPAKYYPIDLGLRASVVARGGLDLGKRFETAVFHALRRKYGVVHFWREQKEVDFVIEIEGQWRPVQVSWEGALPRHRIALDEFAAAFPHAGRPIIISRDNAEQWLGD